jgi:NAD(P)-dependent dehydrogenase (short-subunit alcohol dehydrogenase family)
VADENDSVNEFTGKTIVVTGASSGIGLAAVEEFARRGARVALVGRDQARLDAAVAAVRPAARPDAPPQGFRADFDVLDDVRRLAGALAEAYPSIDVLCNNAGAIIPSRQSTVDGHERTMQGNHLAPYLLTNLLRERLAGGRVITTSSDAHQQGRLDPAHLGSPGTYRPFVVYGTSKQANILFATEAARHWPEILSFAYHPGVVRTRFGRDSFLVSLFYKVAPFLLTPARGADTMVWLAGTPADRLTNGGYYVKRRLTRPVAAAADPATAASLWEASAEATGLPRS